MRCVRMCRCVIFVFLSPSSHVFFRLLGKGGERHLRSGSHARHRLIPVSVSSLSLPPRRVRALGTHCKVSIPHSRINSKRILSTHLPIASQIAVSSLSPFPPLLSSKLLASPSPQHKTILYTPPRIPHLTSLFSHPYLLPPLTPLLTHTSRLGCRRCPALV